MGDVLVKWEKRMYELGYPDSDEVIWEMEEIDFIDFILNPLKG